MFPPNSLTIPCVIHDMIMIDKTMNTYIIMKTNKANTPTSAICTPELPANVKNEGSSRKTYTTIVRRDNTVNGIQAIAGLLFIASNCSFGFVISPIKDGFFKYIPQFLCFICKGCLRRLGNSKAVISLSGERSPQPSPSNETQV